MPSSGLSAAPAAWRATCPRCKALRPFTSIDGGTGYNCAGCEWYFTFGTQAPTGTTNAAITAGTNTTLSVASGGASFTNGMFLWCDTGLNTELVKVTGSPTGTSIPIPAGFIKNHLTAMAFGQLLITPTYQAAGERVPNAPGWGF
jgi:hypothetical protein